MRRVFFFLSFDFIVIGSNGQLNNANKIQSDKQVQLQLIFLKLLDTKVSKKYWQHYDLNLILKMSVICPISKMGYFTTTVKQL